jgi:hypothetical protein
MQMKIPRKRRNWIGLQRFTPQAIGLDTPAGDTLLEVDSDAVGLTVARIVGSIIVYGSNAADIGCTTWGIAKVAVIAAGTALVDPLDSVERQRNIWMHTRTVWQPGTTSMNNNIVANSFKVDIKTMRKFEPGEALSMQWNTTLTNGAMIAYELRALILK